MPELSDTYATFHVRPWADVEAEARQKFGGDEEKVRGVRERYDRAIADMQAKKVTVRERAVSGGAAPAGQGPAGETDPVAAALPDPSRTGESGVAAPPGLGTGLARGGARAFRAVTKPFEEWGAAHELPARHKAAEALVAAGVSKPRAKAIGKFAGTALKDTASYLPAIPATIAAKGVGRLAPGVGSGAYGAFRNYARGVTGETPPASAESIATEGLETAAGFQGAEEGGRLVGKVLKPVLGPLGRLARSEEGSALRIRRSGPSEAPLDAPATPGTGGGSTPAGDTSPVQHARPDAQTSTAAMNEPGPLGAGAGSTPPAEPPLSPETADVTAPRAPGEGAVDMTSSQPPGQASGRTPRQRLPLATRPVPGGNEEPAFVPTAAVTTTPRPAPVRPFREALAAERQTANAAKTEELARRAFAAAQGSTEPAAVPPESLVDRIVGPQRAQAEAERRQAAYAALRARAGGVMGAEGAQMPAEAPVLRPPSGPALPEPATSPVAPQVAERARAAAALRAARGRGFQMVGEPYARPYEAPTAPTAAPAPPPPSAPPAPTAPTVEPLPDSFIAGKDRAELESDLESALLGSQSARSPSERAFFERYAQTIRDALARDDEDAAAGGVPAEEAAPEVPPVAAGPPDAAPAEAAGGVPEATAGEGGAEAPPRGEPAPAPGPPSPDRGAASPAAGQAEAGGVPEPAPAPPEPPPPSPPAAAAGGRGDELPAPEAEPVASEPEKPPKREKSVTLGSGFGALGGGEEPVAPVHPAAAKILEHVSLHPEPKARASLGALKTAVLDDLEPIRAAVAEADKPVPAERDPYVLARLFRGWTGKAEHFLERGPVLYDDLAAKPAGKSLHDVLGPVAGDVQNFRAYLVARRATELHAQGKATGIADADAAAAVKALESPTFRQAAEDLDRYQDHVLRYLRDSGVLSDRSYTAMREANRAYVPFYRVVPDVPGPGAGASSTRFANLFNPVKSLKGSTRNVIDPLESIVKNTYALVKVAEENRVGRALADLSPREDLMTRLPDDVMSPEEIKAAEDEVGAQLPANVIEALRRGRVAKAGEPVVTIFRNGFRERYRLHPDLYRAVLALDREPTNTLIRLLSKPASVLRAGAVLAPEFQVRNPIRDQFTAFIQSRYRYKPGYDFVRGLMHVLRRDDLYAEFQRSGAPHAVLVGLDRDYLREGTEDVVAGKTPFAAFQPPNVLRHPIQFLRALSELGEEATRLGEYGRAREQGASVAAAGLSARDVTVDFQRMGAKMQAVNQLVAFFNAQVQGPARAVRAFREDPKGAMLRAFTGITLPSLALWYANHDDKRVQALPQWEKDLFWIVPTEKHLWRIPKPFELGVLFGSFPERLLDYAEKKDPEILKRWTGQFANAMLPGNWPPSITATQPVTEVWANKDAYTGRPIVPRSQERLEPAYQASPYGSEVARRLGLALGYSPAKIDHLIRGYTAGLGTAALAAVDPLLRKDTPAHSESTAADIPGVRGLVARWPTTDAQPIEDFYARYEAASQAKATGKAFRDPAAARAYQQAHATDIGLVPVYGSVARQLAASRKLMQQVRVDPRRTATEKRVAEDAIAQHMIDLASAANEMVARMRERRASRPPAAVDDETRRKASRALQAAGGR